MRQEFSRSADCRIRFAQSQIRTIRLKKFRQLRAVFAGRTLLEDPRKDFFLKRPGRAVPSLITTMTDGWTFTSSIAGSATSITPIHHCGMPFITTIGTELLPMSPRRLEFLEGDTVKA